MGSIDINVLGVCHQADPKYVKWVWWYSILEDKLEGKDLTEVEKHASSKFTLVNNDFNKCARGKVILFKDKYYVLIWTPGYQVYPNSILEKIIRKINRDFNIDHVINENAQEIFKEN